MKATGIVRRIDDLGRVVIPKEIRRTMRIREGDPLEIFTNRDGEVIFKKYSPIGELSGFATQYAETLAKISGRGVCITDKDMVIAVSGASKKEMFEKKISSEVEMLIQERSQHIQKHVNDKAVYILEDSDKFFASVLFPILSDGDSIGTVIFFGDGVEVMSEVEQKLAQTAAAFLGRQME
ncbi:MAG: stage V sporulation protein T [Clostridia bacterium]|nr:stage V sporulation protein T [Clostridia bacterium]